MISLKRILMESESESWEYQLRDVGGPVFYRRKSPDDTWQFTDAVTFAEGLASGAKLIEYKDNE